MTSVILQTMKRALEQRPPLKGLNLKRDEKGLLETVFWYDEPSRPRLASLTGFSPTKINNLVADLMSKRLLVEGELQESSAGRRSTGVHLNPELGYIVGIELGASRADILVANSAMKDVSKASCSIEIQEDPKQIVHKLQQQIQVMLDKRKLRTTDVMALGIGVPGPVEFSTGLQVRPPLMPRWAGFDLRDQFTDGYRAPIFVDNDVNVMALGELWYTRANGTAEKEGPPLENFLIVKLGTGVGAAIISRGELYRGENGGAGEIAHLCVDPDGPLCRCGQKGCLETVAGAPGIVRAALEAGQNGSSSRLAAILARTGTLTTTDVGIAAQEGDGVANAIIQQAGRCLGMALAGFVDFINPSRVLIGGGLSHIEPSLLASIRQGIYGRAMPLMSRKLVVDHLLLGEEAGVYGAGALALLGFFDSL